MQSLKQECTRLGIPLMCRFRFLRPHEPAAGTHTVYLDPARVSIVGRNGHVFNPVGIGFDEDEAFADLIVTLKNCMGARGTQPEHDLIVIGRSAYEDDAFELVLGRDLTV